MMQARIERIRFMSRDPQALAAFYRDALGFSDFGASLAQDNASISLMLGDEILDLVQASSSGRSYPVNVPGWSPLFQHIAIVVEDMDAAYARLRAHSGWRQISIAGPERLPASSGSVTAFKFRDPEGHPLEFLSFPPEKEPDLWAARRNDKPGALHLGIDHTAISVGDTGYSVAFYETIGFERIAGSMNSGPEQSRLDGIEDATLEVTSLAMPDARRPNLELLCYQGDFKRTQPPPDPGDIAATQIVFASAVDANRIERDPDGHLLAYAPPST